MSQWQTDSGRWLGGVLRTRRRGSRRMWGPVWGGGASLALLGAASVLAAVAMMLVLVSGVHAGPPSWTILSSPDPNLTSGNLLLGVAAYSPHDAWAVGTTDSQTGPQTLTMHWTGHWQYIPSPSVPGENTSLDAVAEVSPHDVWAVGFSNPGNTLIEHWNGTSWQIVPSPNVSAGMDVNQLVGVASVQGSGGGTTCGPLAPMHLPPSFCMQPLQSYTLIEHWNGFSWQVVGSPNVSPAQEENSLEGVAVVSPTDVWAVGTWGSLQSAVPHVPQTLIEHWNGTGWSVTSSPNAHPNVDSNVLSAVAGDTPNNVWAVGNFDSTTTNIQQTLTELYH